MKPWLKKALIVLGTALIVSQFIPIDRSVPETNAEDDFLAIVKAPVEIASVIKDACYDCHSHESKYPWYSKVSPLSFWIQGHVKGGREKLNFSTWASYPPEKAAHKLEECYEFVSETRMPLLSYILLHPEARLTEVQRTGLAQWFNQQYKAGIDN